MNDFIPYRYKNIPIRLFVKLNVQALTDIGDEKMTKDQALKARYDVIKT